MKVKYLLFLFCLTAFLPLFSEGNKRVLIGSPIRQKPAILHEFLESLKRLEQEGYEADYFFIDDNDVADSTYELIDFADQCDKNCIILNPEAQVDRIPYTCNENTHYWSDANIWKVAAFKDTIIEHAIDKEYDYLFLIDSDIVLHPRTIVQLIATEKDVVSNIFWTSWQNGAIEQPQVWLFDEYTQYQVIPGNTITDEIKREQVLAFYHQLRVPGTYEVGGLGACTLISRNALTKGARFKKISNLTFWGEDRHFCIRAAALGLSLFVDTHFPAYHIYRESNLIGVPDFIANFKPRVTLSMVVKNEADRYLREVLSHAKECITDAVIIDDCSEDNTIEVCREILKGIPLKLIQNNQSLFSNEVNLRKLQFEETLKTNPDWILVLDADEIFEEKFKSEIHKLISNKNAEVYCFRLYDFWDQNHYREDTYWRGHLTYRPFLLRNKCDIEWTWLESPQHCGRLPQNIISIPWIQSHMRLKHFGWAKEEDRIAKYQRYLELDPGFKYGWKEQYESINDKEPNLIEWVE